MGIYDSLEAIRAEIDKCMKCGNCQAVCPIYKETRKEAGVARGKIRLIKHLLETGEATPELGEKLSLCLTCKACNANCPCGVKFDRIIMAARSELVRKKGLPLVKKAIFGTLKRRAIFRLGIKSGATFQSLIFKKHPQKNAGSVRFPIGLDAKRIVPSLASKSLLESVSEINKVAGKPKMRVAFYTGCMTNFIYTDLGKATINVLLANKVEVVVPKAQHCCGIPVLAHGDAKTAKEMAKSNIDIVLNAKVDAIITSCATCGHTWKKEYRDLLKDDPAYAEKVKEVVSKFYDITEFLVNIIKFDRKKLGKVNTKVTYHDPCHLVRGQGIKNEPREIIKAIPGVEFVEMKAPDRCCGGAGSFSLTHYDLSMDIHSKKADDIKQTNTQQVLTSCPGCRMQLEDGINMFSMSHPVQHVVQLLDQSYQVKQKNGKMVG